MPTIEELRARAQIIASEKQIGGNTAQRVGGAFSMTADLIEGVGGRVDDATAAAEAAEAVAVRAEALTGTAADSAKAAAVCAEAAASSAETAAGLAGKAATVAGNALTTAQANAQTITTEIARAQAAEQILSTQLTRLKKNIYDMGNFTKSSEAEARAATPAIAGDADFILLRYCVPESTAGSSAFGYGYIEQHVNGNTTEQYLYWQTSRYYRLITFTDATRQTVASVASWYALGYVTPTQMNYLRELLASGGGAAELQYVNALAQLYATPTALQTNIDDLHTYTSLEFKNFNARLRLDEDTIGHHQEFFNSLHKFVGTESDPKSTTLRVRVPILEDKVETLENTARRIIYLNDEEDAPEITSSGVAENMAAQEKYFHDADILIMYYTTTSGASPGAMGYIEQKRASATLVTQILHWNQQVYRRVISLINSTWQVGAWQRMYDLTADEYNSILNRLSALENPS